MPSEPTDPATEPSESRGAGEKRRQNRRKPGEVAREAKRSQEPALTRARSCFSNVQIMQPFHGTLRSQFAKRLRGEIGHIIPLNNNRSGRLI